jgi:peptidoglycan/LPS O-acetylase OafA/YrhL
LLCSVIAWTWSGALPNSAAFTGDVVAALGDVANWRFVFAKTSYAGLFDAPSPVLHFWSLAIEK